MFTKREVRCINPECRALNRVTRYSIKRIPSCGKCHWNLPEHGAIKVLRRVYTIPRVVWIGAVALALIYWITIDQSAPVVTRSAKTVPPSAQRSVACSPVEPVTIHGIYRVYDTNDQPRLTQWTINAGAGANYFIKLVDAASGAPKVSYFVYGGSILTTDAPVGTFVVKHAAGDIWCGEQKLFGDNTSTKKGTNLVTFREDYTYTYFLTPMQNGNFPTKRIPRSEF